MEEVISKLQEAKSVAVLPHKNEDGDALGSCFALAEGLRSIGKEAVIYVSGTIEKRLDFIGMDYEIYNSEKQYKHDLCVCVDCGDLERVGDRKKMFNEIGNTANIDHHYSNTRFAQANYVDGDASSAGQIIYKVMKRMNIQITKTIAEHLYTAICSDTGCFKYSNVSSETMQIAGELISKGIDSAEIARMLFENETLTAVQIKSEASSEMDSYCDGRIRLVSMTKEMYKKYDISEIDVPNLVDIPRMIENTEIAICLKEQKDGIRINLRSNGESDVSLVAKAFGGGGHKKASGCTATDISLDELKERIVEECMKHLK